MILIDGVVGAGKSTLAEILSKKLDIPVQYELSNGLTLNILDSFYSDMERNSFLLQIHFLNERFKMIKDIQKTGIGILDRSIFGDKIFASLLNEDKKMSDNEYEVYCTLLDNMLEHVKKPNLLIYIDCDLDTAIERIAKRNREMELGVDRDYWNRLNIKYKDWYNNYDMSDKICLDLKDFDSFNEDHINELVNNICLNEYCY